MPKRLETAGLVVAFITWNNLMLSFTYSFVSTFIWEFSILFYFPLFYFPLSPVLCLCLTFWTSETQFTAVGSCSLLQGIFPNQESNPGLPHCRQILYQLSYQGSPYSMGFQSNHFPLKLDLPQLILLFLGFYFFSNLLDLLLVFIRIYLIKYNFSLERMSNWWGLIFVYMFEKGIYFPT